MNSSSNQRTELAGALYAMRHTFLALAAFSGVINLLMLAPAVYMLQIYDRALVSSNVNTLLMLTLLVVGLYVLMAMLEAIRSWVMVRVGNRLDERLNQRIFTAAFERNLSRAGGSPSQALQDLTQVRQFLTGNGLFAFFDAPWTPLYLFVAYLIHPWLGMLTLAGTLILLSLAVITELVTRKPLAISNQAAAASGTFANNNLRNTEAIEAMGMLPAIRDRWYRHHRQSLLLQARASDRSALINGIGRFVRVTLQSLVLGTGALLAIRGEITPGMMIACSILTGRALAPVELAISNWKPLLNARVSWKRLAGLLDAYPAQPPSLRLPRPEGRLEAENLVAAIPGDAGVILRGVAFRLEPGQSLGVIGPSGSGKSTLARLCVGLWGPRAGSMRLDGAELHRWNKQELGPWIGYLPQDVELCEGSISDNIARFGELDSDAVVEAARQADVHEMILRFPEGYATRLDADGNPLSGGQKQRIALARALYGNPALVVLDEPNSNLDDAGESALVQALARLKERGATLVLISHRPNILANVDQVMMLRDGMMQLQGKRDEVFGALRKANIMAAPSTTPVAAARAKE
ncbi:type I secretion system permease/ATPase [Halomonas urumqiensis]|uniref:Type I secretion system permease/ATPase n=1 Tax=Halomonas urumqiensis TaxID=1684789 RepID=A0A2N7UD35_9GAMM|nr:type I secretion system permease/ATPase [Halomonas urumqiensis]PMR78362.1 type I secretion system permease/ATPase [Halomonas urumqiensis]PTB03509.1 type I secretion system permease/ATPase [Halomonas urumqiensis]GHE20301.1 alkaline protease secretion ATP-binding protein AprD [Halomonas urumqiensis]